MRNISDQICAEDFLGSLSRFALKFKTGGVHCDGRGDYFFFEIGWHGMARHGMGEEHVRYLHNES